MNNFFSEQELEVVIEAIKTVLDLGIECGKVKEEDKGEYTDHLIKVIVAFKLSNFKDEDMNATDLGEFLGAYAATSFNDDMDERKRSELELFVAMSMIDLDDFPEIAKLEEIDELVEAYKEVNSGNDEIMIIALLRHAYNILDEDGVKEFFSRV